jgi:hypothetical protein
MAENERLENRISCVITEFKFGKRIFFKFSKYVEWSIRLKFLNQMFGSETPEKIRIVFKKISVVMHEISAMTVTPHENI